MSTESDFRHIRRCHIFSLTAGAGVILVGVLALVGWALDITALLKSVLANLPSMKPTTALGFILAGTSLIFLRPEETGRGRSLYAKRAAQICASGVALIGLATLTEYLTGWDLGVDQLLFPGPGATPGTAMAARMAVPTAFSFLLLGCALLLLDVKTRRGHRPTEFLALLLGAISLVVLTGYGFGAKSLIGSTSYTEMSLHTSLAFGLLSLGILCARAEHGFMAVVTTDTLGGQVTRNLLPFALGLPLFLAWVRWQGERAGLYGTEFGLALFATMNIVVFIILIFWSAVHLNRGDKERRKSEKRFRELIEHAPDSIVVVSDKGEIVMVNAQTEKLFGYEREELIGQTVETLLPEGFRHRHRMHRVEYMAHPGVRPMGIGLELWAMAKDGRKIPVEVALSLLEAAEGPLISASIRDITERKRAAEALRKSEENYRMVLQNIQEIVYMVKTNGDPLRGSVQFVSPYVRNVVGCEPTEFLEDPALWFRLLHPDDIPAVVHTTGQIIATRQPSVREYRIRHKETGEYHWMEDNVVPQFDDSGNLVATFGVARDVTERRRLETQLLQAQKMEAIGRLAGGVAHDFNNLLTVILGHSGQLLERLAAADPLRKNAESVQRAAYQSASLTKQLLAFSRQQIFEVKVVDLNAILWELSEMLRPLLGEDIELTIRFDPALGRVKADPGQINQVLMNLAVNARDAMPKGGKLIIETAHAELDDSYAREHFPVQPGPYVMVAVTDSGAGMDEQTKAHIFEPFFTTKERGHGTGLGLATVYGIVKQSGGYIWVYSEPGHGTTFKVYLPRVESAADVTNPAGSSDSILRASETILLAEDCEEVRDMAREFLEHYGYRVLAAESTDAAVEMAKSHPGPIHLLLTDVVMPGMSGRELAGRVQQLRPELKVLYVSGYTSNAIVERGILLPGIAFLQKPFTREALARKVREVLSGRETP